MPRLFHVSDDGPFTVMTLRPSPPGTPYAGRPYVWAVDEAHLPNYLLPRDCPRVGWRPAPGDPAPLASAAARVLAVERGWVAALVGAALRVHELAPDGFTELDPMAGYWVSQTAARVVGVDYVDNCFTALAGRDVELRVTDSLGPYIDAVVSRGGEFSVIRERNAQPRGFRGRG